MILYLGTSSLIKLYVEEPDSGNIRRWADEAEILATCRVAYTEAIAAIDLRHKEGDLSTKDYNHICESLSSDWKAFAVVDFDDLDAGSLVKKHGLNRMDAIHLSAAIRVCKSGRKVDVVFSSVSEPLCRAAALEGLRVLPLL